ncbi:MAG: DUF2779 domain-containing protein [Anaerorhabdus sp.]
MYLYDDIKKINFCENYYLLSQQNLAHENLKLRKDYDIYDLIIAKLKITDFFIGDFNTTNEELITQLNSKKYVLRAFFQYRNIKVEVPCIKRVNNGIDVYFVSYLLYPKLEHSKEWKYAISVLKKFNLHINNVYAIYINGDYVYKNKIDPSEALLISRNFHNNKKKQLKKIKSVVCNKLPDLDYISRKLKKSSSINSIEKKDCCEHKMKCVYSERCTTSIDLQEDDSILTLTLSKNKTKMYRDGILLLKDADLDLVEGSKAQYAQIMASKNGGLFINYYALKGLFDQLQYPLIFVDFEWDIFPLPIYDGMKPFETIVFQYSIHILHENGEVKHHEYLNEKDCREDLLINLLNDIPKVGTILSFGATGAECLRLKELAKQFNGYSKQIDDILNRIKDFILPFTDGVVYHIKMRGQYSLKALMSIMENDGGYDELEIKQGADAVLKWRSFSMEEDSSEKVKIKEQLLKYCAMDTYSMVVIYKWLNRKLEKWLKGF